MEGTFLTWSWRPRTGEFSMNTLLPFPAPGQLPALLDQCPSSSNLALPQSLGQGSL